MNANANANADARPRDRSRRFDIVLWGATGFTGQLVAEYLAEQHGDGDLRWALAGRNLGKLERVRSELAARVPAAAELPLLTGDSLDGDSLRAIAAETSVVCTTVGPYSQYGSELVAACVDHQTDYCDLTGETPFIRQMIDAHHQRAQEVGARIVHCCGFDSIPSDLGVLMLQEEMRRRHGAPLDEIKMFMRAKGGASGGTVASMLYLLEAAKKDRSIRRIMMNPYSLNPADEQSGPDGADSMGARFDRDLGQWAAPFVMAGINTRVVRRSNALKGFEYGRQFRYSEEMSMGRGFKGMLRSASMVAGLAGFVAAASVGPVRSLLKRRVLPKPGEGPSRAEREAGHFTGTLLGKGADANGQSVSLRGTVKGYKDPGYGETAKMLAESALCLALDGASQNSGGGVLTPASAMGTRLIERLRDAGMTFEVE